MEPQKRHHVVVRVAHWLNALVLPAMIASGLQIYRAFPHEGPRGAAWPNPFDGVLFPEPVRLGGWLAGGLNWHFALAWPFVICGVVYLVFVVASGAWRSLFFGPRDIKPALRKALAYVLVFRRRPHGARAVVDVVTEPGEKYNPLQKGAYAFIIALGAVSVLSGAALYKPVQLAGLAALFGGYESARYVHFIAVWLFTAFTVVHVALVFLEDPRSLRAMITGLYKKRAPPAEAAP